MREQRSQRRQAPGYKSHQRLDGRQDEDVGLGPRDVRLLCEPDDSYDTTQRGEVHEAFEKEHQGGGDLLHLWQLEDPYITNKNGKDVQVAEEVDVSYAKVKFRFVGLYNTWCVEPLAQ